MYKKDGVSVNHLLIHCQVAQEMPLVLIWFGVEWMFPFGVDDLLHCWRGARVGRRKTKRTLRAGKLTEKSLNLFIATGKEEVLSLIQALNIQHVLTPVLPTRCSEKF